MNRRLDAALVPETAPHGRPGVARVRLRQKALSGVRWTAVSQFAQQGMGFVCTTILARVLAPADYGLMAMVVVVTGFAAIFRDLGTASALIQRKDVTHRLISSVFWINVAMGIFIALSTAGISPLMALFFREPRVAVLLCGLAPVFIVSSFSIVQQSLLQRDMVFSRIAQFEVLTAGISYLAAIAAALNGWGVWSLVLQQYASAVCMVVLLWPAAGWRPSFAFAWADVRSLSRYSFNLAAYSIVNYCARRTDSALIGRYLGSTSLGYYGMAYRLMQYPGQLINGLIGRVLFSTLSRVQDDDETFLRTYLRVVSAIALVTSPILFGLCALARPFVLCVLSPKWEPIVYMLMILSMVGLNQAVAGTTGQIYTSKGRTDLMFRVGTLNSLIYVGAIVTGLRWGTLGVVIFYALADAIATPIDYLFSFRLINLRLRTMALALWRPYACGLFMAMIVYSLANPCQSRLGRIPGLAALVGLGAVLYVSASLILNRASMREFMKIARGNG